jgi:quinol monooxygenase YgiN
MGNGVTESPQNIKFIGGVNMTNQQVQLNIRFKAKPGKKEEFRKELFSLIEEMSSEKAFISAIVSDDLDQPDDLIIYETWQGTRDSWLAEEFIKPYRKNYEGTLGDLIVDRSVTWLQPNREWGSHITNAY